MIATAPRWVRLLLALVYASCYCSCSAVHVGWSPDGFGSQTEMTTGPRIFYKTFTDPLLVGPPHQMLAGCYKRMKKVSISLEQSKVGGVKGYMAEDLGDYYLAQQMSIYPNKTTSLEDAALVVINGVPRLSQAVGQCDGLLNSTHIERMYEIKAWMTKNSEALKRIPTVWSCSSWLCEHQAMVPSSISETLASIDAAMLLEEAGPQFVWHPGPKTRGHANYFARHKIVAYVVPYSANHGLPRPAPNIEKRTGFIFIGSLRRQLVRTKLCEVALKEPDVYLHVHNKDNKREASCSRNSQRNVHMNGAGYTMAERSRRRRSNTKFMTDAYDTKMTSAKFCFVPAGDTPTSRRLFDAIIAGCLPVIISDALAGNLPFPSSIPYDEFVFWIPEAAWLEDPYTELQKIRELDPIEIARRQTVMAKYAAPRLDWLSGTHVLYSLIHEIMQGNRRRIGDCRGCSQPDFDSRTNSTTKGVAPAIILPVALLDNPGIAPINNIDEQDCKQVNQIIKVERDIEEAVKSKNYKVVGILSSERDAIVKALEDCQNGSKSAGGEGDEGAGAGKGHRHKHKHKHHGRGI